MPPARRTVAGARRRRPAPAADPLTPDPHAPDPHALDAHAAALAGAAGAELPLAAAGVPAAGAEGDGAATAMAPRVPPGELLVVGRIGKPQGLRGEVTVEVRTDEPDARFADGGSLLTEPAERGPLVVAATREQGGRLVVLFEGVPDRTAAEALRGTLLLVDAATLPVPDDPDVFLDVHLQGLRAELPDGTRVGTVTDVLHLPHGDVLVVRRDPVDGGAPAGEEVLVPFVAAMVPVVDVAGGRLVLDPPPGLLEPVDDEADDQPDEGPADPT